MVGWTKRDVVEKCEVRRKEKAQKFHELKVKKQQAREKASGHADVANMKNELAKYGF